MDTESFGTEALTRSIFPNIMTDSDGRNPHLRIQCNWCSSAEYIFYEGDECDAPGTDWLAAAIKHIATNHPTQLKTL